MEFISEGLLWGWNGFTDYIIPFILVLSVLVFVHEWGHFIIARLFGVKVETFSIGFGKELFGFDGRHGTRWKISLIPLGGYVQMFGDTDPSSAHSKADIVENEQTRPMTEAERSQAFFAKPVWQRALIVFAGPAINFLFAILLLVGLYLAVGKPVNPPVAAAIFADGAGYEAGLKPQDRIIKIDGKDIQSFSDIQRQVAISLNRPLETTILRNGQEKSVTITPAVEEMEDRFGFKHSKGMIGIMGMDKGIALSSIVSIAGKNVSELSQQEKATLLQLYLDKDVQIELPLGSDEVKSIYVHAKGVDGETLVLADESGKEILPFTVGDAVIEAFRETWFIVSGTFEALGQIITGTRSATELGGIVRIGAVAGDAAQSGLLVLITFTAMLSINLGLINLFPIPLLDGGHLVFYAYEAVFGKPMSEKVMEYALKCGMIFLITLMAFANINDIIQMVL